MGCANATLNFTLTLVCGTTVFVGIPSRLFPLRPDISAVEYPVDYTSKIKLIYNSEREQYSNSDSLA